MSIDINEEEKEVICHALNVYLSDLGQEIAKTEAHKMKEDLHRERDVLKGFVSRCD